MKHGIHLVKSSPNNPLEFIVVVFFKEIQSFLFFKLYLLSMQNVRVEISADGCSLN